MELKLAIRGRGMRIEDAASVLGMSRQNLYYHMNRSELEPDFIQNVKTKLGIVLTEKPKPKPDFKNIGGKGTYTPIPGGTIELNDLILLSIEQLYSLQNEQEDLQMVKAIQQVIAYKQYAEGLERENKLLKEMIELLKQKKKP